MADQNLHAARSAASTMGDKPGPQPVFRSLCRAVLALMALVSPLPAAVAQVAPPLPLDVFIDPRELTVLNDGHLVFNAFHPAVGQGLWTLDVKNGAVELLTTRMRPGFLGAAPSGLTPFKGNVYFAADDGHLGVELWRSDGTRAGTRLVKDIDVGSEGSIPAFLTAFEGQLFFAARAAGSDGHRLWRTAGDAASTVPVPGANGLGNPRQLTVAGGKLFFTATAPAIGDELWVMDSAGATPRLVKDIRPGVEDSTSTQLTAAGDLLFFVATDGQHGLELWKSDGTSAGTTMVKDIRSGIDASRPNYLVAAGRTVFFAANDGQHGLELWKSDGTDGGTVMVKDIRPGPQNSGVSFLAEVDGLIYFSATDGEHGVELWKSDGSEGGSTMVADLLPGAGSSLPTALTRIGHRLMFAAADAQEVQQLWQSDGSAAGTRPMGKAGASYPFPYGFVAVGGSVAFIAKDTAGNDRLWTVEPTGDIRLIGPVLQQKIR